MGHLFSRAALLLLAALWGVTAWGAPLDLVLVLDNSGSMRKLDPSFLSREKAADFLDALPEEFNVGLILFDQTVRLTNPLAPATADHKAALRASLRSMDLRGQFTDSPAAVERAILELSLRGRPQVPRTIVFASDGIVDTGSASLDRERADWLRDDLTREASAGKIRLLALAFTAGADLVMLNALAERTRGEMVRAVNPEDLEAAYAGLRDLLTRETPVVDAEIAAAAAQKAARLSPEEKAALEALAKETGVALEELLAGVETESDAPDSGETPVAPAEDVGDAEALFEEIPEDESDPESVASEAVSEAEILEEFLSATPESLAAEAGAKSATDGKDATETLVLSPEERRALEEMSRETGVPVEDLYRELQSAPADAPVITADKKTGLLARQPALVWGGGGLLVLMAALLWWRLRSGSTSVGAATTARHSSGRAMLVDVHGITGTPSRALGGRQMVVGRTMGVDTEQVDYFVINKATVGRRHAILKQKDGVWWLVDLGSVNGTFVNDERVLGERQLRPGDRIRFHKFEFEFATEGRESPQAVPYSGDQTLASERNALLAAGLSAEDLAALEADREAFFSNPDGDDVNIEPRAVAGRDDRTLGDGRAAAQLSERSAEAALGKDLTFEVPVPAAGKAAVDPDLQKTQRLQSPGADSA